MWNAARGSNLSVLYFSDISLNQTTVNHYSSYLSSWQRYQLQGLNKQGIECLLKVWILLLQHPIQGPYCNGTWDDIFCWPPTMPGVTVTAPCYEVMKNDADLDVTSMNVTGDAYRICTDQGTWLWDNWTNYNQCADNIPQKVDGNRTEEESMQSIKIAITYILFIGSLLSLLCLSASLIIFYHFKSIRCDRITVHVHLMLALLLRAFILIILTEPLIFNRTYHYRNIDWCCKLVLAIQFYATVASINWMFVQGHYLHSRLTTNIFDRGLPLKTYATLGWGVPFVLVASWSAVMETYHPVHCWQNYGELHYNWIIVGPMLFVLLINLVFLGNIMRILLTKIQLTSNATESEQVRRAVKATVVLFPLLGVNNLLFVYNPGGTGEIYYMFTNVILQSSQGIFVSLLYCFVCKDVRDAFKREYGRFTARRNANSVRSHSVSVSVREKISRRLSKGDGASVAFRRSPNPSPGTTSVRSENLQASGENDSPFRDTVVFFPNNNLPQGGNVVVHTVANSPCPSPLLARARSNRGRARGEGATLPSSPAGDSARLLTPPLASKTQVNRWSGRHSPGESGKNTRCKESSHENNSHNHVIHLPPKLESRPRLETDIF